MFVAVLQPLSDHRAWRACLLATLAWGATVADASASGTPVATDRITPELARRVIDEVSLEVSELRGLEFTRPVDVEVVDDDEARAHVLRRVESFNAAEAVEQTDRVYKLLGLLPPDADTMEALLGALREQAAGFYDPERGVFYLLDDLPAAAVEVVAAHELTHALEDQHFDLDRGLREVIDDDDRLFARGAVHEGSATLVMTLVATRAILDGRADASALAALEGMAGGDALAGLPPVLLRQFLAPYVLGPGFITHGRPATALASGYPTADAERLYADPPESSEQILHPEKYWDPERLDPPRTVSLGDAGRKLGGKWQREGSGVLGELTLASLVERDTQPGLESLIVGGASAWTNPAVSGWDGDRWELWRRGNDHALLLLTVWDSESDAREFAAALPTGHGLTWKQAGDRVAIVAGPVGRRASRLLDALTSLGADLESPRSYKGPTAETVALDRK